MNNLKQNAINLFIKFYRNKYKKEDIIKIKKIHNGFTNISFYFKLNNGSEFQVRLGRNNDIVDRVNEVNALKIINNDSYLYYDVKSGNSIKKWIKGRTLNKNDLTNEILAKIIKKIYEFQNIKPTPGLLKHDYYSFYSNGRTPKKYLDAYKKIVEKVSTTSWGFSHNDLNLENMLIDNDSNIHFIDFEWSRINHPYWDFANLIKETLWSYSKIVNFSKIAKLNLKLLVEITFVAICFSYQWTYSNSFSFKILIYRLKMYMKMIHFYKMLKKVILSR